MTVGEKEEPVEKIQTDVAAAGDEDMGNDSGERIACPDESCVGAIGEDGFCGVCGRPSDGALPARRETDEGAVSEAAGTEPEGEEEEEDATADEEGAGERVLCADESCVGLVGEDGYCELCGLLWKADGYAEGETLKYREDSER